MRLLFATKVRLAANFVKFPFGKLSNKIHNSRRKVAFADAKAMVKNMKKKIILMSALTLVFMLLLPVLPIAAAPVRNVISYMMYLFVPYLLCPVCSIVVGAIAGTDIRRLWYFVFLPAAVAFGTYLYLMDLNGALVLSGCYLMLGLAALGISALVKVHQQAKKQNRR